MSTLPIFLTGTYPGQFAHAGTPIALINGYVNKIVFEPSQQIFRIFKGHQILYTVYLRKEIFIGAKSLGAVFLFSNHLNGHDHILPAVSKLTRINYVL